MIGPDVHGKGVQPKQIRLERDRLKTGNGFFPSSVKSRFHFKIAGSPKAGYIGAMVVTLPDDVAALKNLTEREVKGELVVALYAGRKLTLVQAADLTGEGLFEFQAILRDRAIPQHYDEADLDQDLLPLRDLPLK